MLDGRSGGRRARGPDGRNARRQECLRCLMRQRRSNFSTRAIRFWASTGARTLASLSKYRKTSRDGSFGDDSLWSPQLSFVKQICARK